MLRATIGQIAVNDALPPALRDHARILDGANLAKLLQEVADKHPDSYRDVLFQLSRIGHHSSYLTGGNSFDLHHMRTAVSAEKMKQEIRSQIARIQGDPKLSDSEKDLQVVEELMKNQKPMEDAIYEESLAEKNPLAYQVKSGARGKPVNLKSLRGADLLYIDHKDRPLPVPILRSYSQGLSPVEYYAGSFGARHGVISAKFATQEAGFLSKQLIQASHRLLVTKHDSDDPKQHALQGMPVDTDDPDNEGALLALPAGGYARNAVLSAKVLADLHSRGIKRIAVRSPIASGASDGGLYGRDVGYRERGGIAPVGDNVGIAAAQAASEPLSQSQLSAKHAGGVAGAGKGATGFKLVDQIVQVPKTFKSGAAHAQIDGRVSGVEPAPHGGTYVSIEGQKHYVGTGFAVHVKPGDVVEAGDVLSEGIPNPADIVRHKGIGEGKRYFTYQFRKAYKDSGLPIHRRNAELIARGLIDHVRLTSEHGHYVHGDVVPYSRFEHFYEPRAGHKMLEPRHALGNYLERPVLHYSIGTKIRPSVVKNLDEFGIKSVAVHPEPPPFEPEMIRGMENLSHDPDWFTRFLGSWQEKNLLQAVHRGSTADEMGTSYVPQLARAVEFNKTGPVKSWKPSSILKS